MVDKKIIEFWNWFSNNEKKLSSDKITNDSISELNRKILLLGDFDWEIREGMGKDNMLIISPGGDAKLQLRTKEIVSASPNLDAWEFLYSKPAKDWNYHFSIDDKGVKRMINASDWEYVLLKFPDDTYDIIIKGLNSIPKEYQFASANIALESILGEELRLSLIKSIDLVDIFPKEYESQRGSIKLLKNHINEIEK